MRSLEIPGNGIGPHHRTPVYALGEELAHASAVMIMVHGRGATAESILELSKYFDHAGVTYIAHQANGHLWYPYSFLAPIEQNEPALSSALHRLTEIVDFVKASGIPEERIMLLGFSQGASLSMEWTARTGRNIGALFGLSGGLIGPPGTPRRYPGTFSRTYVMLGCSDIDPHIPKERVIESAEVFTAMGARVDMTLYPNMAHTVNDDEIGTIDAFVQKISGK